MTRTPKYRPNKYAGTCEHCGQTVAAGAGRVRRDRHFKWYVSHHAAQQVGWPEPRWIGGCPPPPPPQDTSAPDGADAVPDTTPDPQEPETMTPERARAVLYERLLGRPGQPRYRDPCSEEISDRLDADCLRLAAMTPEAMIADADAVATLLEISDHQGWD